MLIYIFVQLLALPVGVSLGKVFHCVSDSKGETMMMYVDNTQGCFASLQWAYAGVAIAFALVFFIAFPVWMIKKTKLQLIFSHSSGLYSCHVMYTAVLSACVICIVVR